MGRLLSNNLHNLDLYKNTEKALKSLGFELADLCEEGADLALGNGGLGRLAACFLDSLATLDYNAMGYGIHYQHGLFKQSFKDGHQIEQPDMWREFGSPWEICRPESTQLIPVYGYVEQQAQAEAAIKAQEEAERQRAANVEHQRTIHNGIIEDVKSVIALDDESIKTIIRGILTGKIRNVSIQY